MMNIDSDYLYINCNIGCNSLSGYWSELQKIQDIKNSGIIPDMMMDLSLVKVNVPLYKYIISEMQIPAGTVFSYIPFSKKNGLVWDECKEYLLQLAHDGVSFVTVHFTANLKLLELAKSRNVPTTSRGGGICLYDMKLNGRTVNLFIEHIDEIIDVALKYGMTISLGTTFRPGTIFDACDEVHIEETRQQLEVCRYLQSKGVNVIVENIGHITLDRIEQHAVLLREFKAPIMPLGPIPTDSAIGQDHISAAIGATMSAYWGVANIINCVTRNEHLIADITSEVMIESIKAMKVVTQAINIARGKSEALQIEKKISDKRRQHLSCMISEKTCKRCNDVCPLRIL